MIGSASIATFIEPGQAFLLAFEQADDYDGIHFKWFRSRYDRFLYVGSVVHRRATPRPRIGPDAIPWWDCTAGTPT
jgi:predicted GNAT superfamily acetyltransferase